MVKHLTSALSTLKGFKRIHEKRKLQGITEPTLTISDAPYVAGDAIAVAFTGASSATDWVGMYVAAAHVGTSRFFRISGL